MSDSETLRQGWDDIAAANDQIRRQAKEIERLRAENADLRSIGNSRAQVGIAREGEMAQLRAERDRYREALARIAVRKDRHHDCGDYERGYGECEAANAAIAREALGEKP
jgi:hypothetical protein